MRFDTQSSAILYEVCTTWVCSLLYQDEFARNDDLSFLPAQHDLTWPSFPACICVWAAEDIDKGFDSFTEDNRRTDASQKQGMIRLGDNLFWHSWTCSQNFIWVLLHLSQYLDFHLSEADQPTWPFFFFFYLQWMVIQWWFKVNGR